MPMIGKEVCPCIEYWVAEAEVKDRKADIAYIKKVFAILYIRFTIINIKGN